MEKVSNRISDARRKVTALVAMARWIWIVNSVVMIAGVAYHRYDVAAVAGFTWVLSLLTAALGHRAAEYLVNMEHTTRLSPPH